MKSCCHLPNAKAVLQMKNVGKTGILETQLESKDQGKTSALAFLSPSKNILVL